MNALLLPGSDARHAGWVEKLKVALSSQFDTTKAQHYRHWRSREERADVEYEIEIAKTHVDNLEPYIIIAKSIGTVIAAKGTSDGDFHPEKLILLGIPINGGAASEVFVKWLGRIDVPIIIVQNTDDPLGSSADIATALEGSGAHLTFVELPGDTHDYLDFETITRLV